ncbi:MAG: GSCFA domain-containing protein [Dysgonomonas sp.]
MEFRTKIDIPASDTLITHKSRILMFGSCFIENMGKLLIDNKFNANLNPFGILYNPQSISQAIRILLTSKKFTEEDIYEHKSIYHSPWHHGTFSDTDKDRCLNKINDSIGKAENDIKNADILIITFGTAYVFRSKEKNIVVGNCHKLPANHFNRYRLDVDSITNDWTELIKELKEVNPSLHILFTVSPIRHLKDGAHDNQISKSTLLLAIDKLIQANPNTSYFPSYEIVLDELRDYRFYNEDMTHPNITAIKYIWERFSETYFNEETFKTMNEWQRIFLAIHHRPSNAQSDEYKDFLRQTLLKLEAFNKKYPYICCEEELSNLQSTLAEPKRE